jgi:uncharacterized protein (TIGR02246 family)
MAALVAAGALALAGCAQKAPAPADTAADEAAVRAINPTWFKAYNAGDADAVAALYADDAVLSIPGAPPARGRAAIREAFVKDIAAAANSGTYGQGPKSDVAISGDLAYEWNTFTVTDKGGATVDTGKYLTVYARKDGKWAIVRDMWNSDAAPASAAAATTAPESTHSLKD